MRFFLLVGVLVAASPTKRIPKPSDVVSSFQELAKKNDVKGCLKLFVQRKNDSRAQQDLMRRVQKYVKNFKRASIAVVEERIDRGCAVVVIRDGVKKKSIDYDPFYLIRQGKKWKLFPRLTRYDSKDIALSKADLARFEKLEKWFKARKAELSR